MQLGFQEIAIRFIPIGLASWKDQAYLLSWKRDRGKDTQLIVSTIDKIQEENTSQRLCLIEATTLFSILGGITSIFRAEWTSVDFRRIRFGKERRRRKRSVSHHERVKPQEEEELRWVSMWSLYVWRKRKVQSKQYRGAKAISGAEIASCEETKKRRR